VENPYQAPVVSTRKRFKAGAFGPLLLRLAILAFCSIQFLSLTAQLLGNWSVISEAISSGVISPLRVATGLMFAVVLMIAGVLLLFSRKESIWLLAVYLVYQSYWFFATPVQSARILGLASLVCLAGCMVYAVRLKQAGQLR